MVASVFRHFTMGMALLHKILSKVIWGKGIPKGDIFLVELSLWKVLTSIRTLKESPTLLLRGRNSKLLVCPLPLDLYNHIGSCLAQYFLVCFLL